MAKKSFENNMKRVIEISEMLEEGGISLDDSLKMYKEAVKTVKILKDELECAKGSVVVLQRDLNGSFIEEEVSDDEF